MSGSKSSTPVAPAPVTQQLDPTPTGPIQRVVSQQAKAQTAATNPSAALLANADDPTKAAGASTSGMLS